MADLDALIRIRRHEIEQRQKALSALYKKAEDLLEQRDILQAQFAIETEKARDLPPAWMEYFAPYAKKVRQDMADIESAHERIEKQIMLAQDEMRNAFGELKKIEIIDDRRRAEFIAEIEKKESALMDEIALNGYVRQGK